MTLSIEQCVLMRDRQNLASSPTLNRQRALDTDRPDRSHRLQHLPATGVDYALDLFNTFFLNASLSLPAEISQRHCGCKTKKTLYGSRQVSPHLCAPSSFECVQKGLACSICAATGWFQPCRAIRISQRALDHSLTSRSHLSALRCTGAVLLDVSSVFDNRPASDHSVFTALAPSELPFMGPVL